MHSTDKDRKALASPKPKSLEQWTYSVISSTAATSTGGCWVLRMWPVCLRTALLVLFHLSLNLNSSIWQIGKCCLRDKILCLKLPEGSGGQDIDIPVFRTTGECRAWFLCCLSWNMMGLETLSLSNSAFLLWCLLFCFPMTLLSLCLPPSPQKTKRI